MHRLAGRVALVTGAGAGIGSAIARRFAEEGAHVIVNDISVAAAEIVAAGLRAAKGAATAHAGDVTRPADVSALLGAIKAAHGKLFRPVSAPG